MFTRKSLVIGLRMSIMMLVFLSSVASAQLRSLPGDNVAGPVASNQDSPAAASSGKSVLTVWADFRANPYGVYEYETSSDIYGMRLDTAGNPIDTMPIPIVTSRAAQTQPQVAWNGSNWLVVYQSVDVGGTGYYQSSLEAVRVAPNGTVLDPKPIKLFGLIPSGPVYWSLASDGNNWVIANQSTPTSGDIVAVRVSPDGVLLDPPNRTIVKETYFMRSGLRLAFANGVFILAFLDNGDTKAVRFDGLLNRLDAAPITLAPNAISGFASSGTGFYAIWTRQEPDFSIKLVGSRISQAGVRLDGNGVVISGSNPPGGYATTSLAWDGTNWRAIWGNLTTTFAARINGSGTVLDPGGAIVPGIPTGVSAGTGAGSVQILWTEYANNNNDVLTANISGTNVPGPARTVSIAAPQQTKPDVAVGQNGYMVSYRSSTAAVARVLAQPLDAAGNPLAPGPVQVDSGSSVNGPGSPNIAWNGSVYLITWASGTNIVGRRILPDGTLLDSSPFTIVTSAYGPADVAALGSDFLVTARKSGPYGQTIYPVGVRVNGAGTVLDATPIVLGGSYLRTPAAVVALGGRWFVAWHQNASHDDSYCMSMGVFVGANGTPGTSFQIHGPFSTAGGNGVFEVGLASNGNTALFVQSQELTSGVENDLLARVIDAAGTVGPAVNLTPWSGNQYRPQAAWDGTSFVVAYQEQKNRLALNTLDQLDARSDLFAMRVSPAGAKLDPQGFVFSASPLAETDPTVAAANGTILLAGAVMNNSAAFGNYRIAYGLYSAVAPAATINATPTGGDRPLTVSFDSGGGLAMNTYVWDFADGTGSTMPNPVHTFSSAGDYLVTLTATDEMGRQTRQARMIVVTDPNIVPVAIATSSVYAGSAPLDVVLSAASSYDPDGVIGNVEWRFSDGSYTYGATAYHTFTTVGQHTVTLLCYDARGGVGSTNITINVGTVNQPPVARASASPSSGSAPLAVQFSSAGSTDPDGTIVEYQWTFGDAFGVISRDPNPLYTYAYPGTYTATLTIWDNNNVSSSANVVISVSSNPATTMRSTAINMSSTLQGKKVTVNGDVVVRNLSGSPVSGAVVSATWTLPNRTFVTQSVTTDTSGVARFRTTSGRGTYTLTVNDIQKSQMTFDRSGSVLSASLIR